MHLDIRKEGVSAANKRKTPEAYLGSSHGLYYRSSSHHRLNCWLESFKFTSSPTIGVTKGI